MNISIIIPTLNEAASLRRLVNRLLTANRDRLEIIVVDGGSIDETLIVAQELELTVLTCDCSRAKQMNLGASHAKHSVLYFIHADTLPPIGYLDDGIAALNNGFKAACYKSKFDSKKKLLRLNEFFTKFNWLVARGGDQSLFISKDTFIDLGMFNEDMLIMEEYPLLKTLVSKRQLFILPKKILISTRKYEDRSWLKVSRANYTAFKLYKKGIDSKTIKQRYNDMLG